MNKQLRLAVLLVALPSALCGWCADAAYAADTSLKQQILPLDCVFETVNDGTGTLHYLTPEACGVVIPQIPVPATSSNGPKLVSLPPVWLPTGTADNSSALIASGLPWQPVVAEGGPAQAGSVLSTARVPNGAVVAGLTIGVTALILLLALLL